MDAFESLVAQMLREKGFWVMQSVKVNLNIDQKREIDKPTTPRPEIDIVALDFNNNILYLIEVKSFIDSQGVKYEDLQENEGTQNGRYKLLTSEKYRNIVSDKLREDWKDMYINSKTQISFGLIAGNVYLGKDKIDKVSNFIKDKNWLYYGPEDIYEYLKESSKKGYENNSVTMSVKIINKFNKLQ